jgi:tRNA threonylcarbamoyl adenosine modification protein YjeE
MRDLAIKLAKNAKYGDIFALKGTLGAGKSFFCKSFVGALTEKPTEVLSPTFNLLLSYQTKNFSIHHFDLYRLRNQEELEEIGFFDCLRNGICLIEWPEIAEDFLPKNYTTIEIKIIDENVREITIYNI